MSLSEVLKLLSLTTAFCLVPHLPGQQPNPPRDPGQSQTDRGRAATGQQGSSTLKEADRKFLQRAAIDGMMEVEISQMAVQKASHAEVKAFAQQMVDDHTSTNQQLQELAGSKGVDMPDKRPAHTQSKASNRLNRLSGPEFERAYMAQQVRHHQKDVAEFERQARSGGDPEVRAFAEKTLPALREHLERARTISASISTGGSEQQSTSSDRDTAATPTEERKDQ